MNPVKFGVRAGLLLALMAGVALVFASLNPATPTHRASAAGPIVANVSCADIYINLAATAAQDPSLVTPGDPPDTAGGDFIVAAALSRTEPSQKFPGDFDTTTVSYLGEATVAPPLPDGSPVVGDCKTAEAAALAGPEAGQMTPGVDFQMIGNKRPSAHSVFDDATDILSFETCAFSEATKNWVRTVSEVKVLDKSGKGAQNFGKVVLYLGTSSPTDPNDPSTCAILPETQSFTSISVVHTRTAQTDFVSDPKAVAASIPQEADGPHPYVKGTPQNADSADGVQDDWDGDGCTDWDELSKGVDETQGRIGGDPFNPNDCGASEHDFSGGYTILATAFPAAKEGQITGDKAVVDSVKSTEVKQGQVVQAVLNVTNGATSVLKNNQKVYWDSDDAAQAGWWQVKYQVGLGTPSASKTVTLNRLFTPPCGLVTTGIPDPATAAPGLLLGVQCVGDVQTGQYFHCISRVDHDTGNDSIDSNLVCYIDAALLATGAVPDNSDGNPGAPPPPPYGSATPSKVVGQFVPSNQRLEFAGCFPNTGGSTGPNIIVETSLDAKSLKGFTNIYFGQSIEDCNENNLSAKPTLVQPTPKGTPSLTVETTLARQDDAKDHDGDGCTDLQELAKPTASKCGDDPYNPHDSDDDVTGVSSITVTVVRADVCQGGTSSQPDPKNSFTNPDPPPDLCAGPNETPEGGAGDDLADGTVIGGNYFQCIADTQGPNTATTTAAYCYSNNPFLTVNCEDNGNGAKVNPAQCSLASSICASFPIHVPSEGCGDGLPGSPPPEPYGDVDDPHTVLNGVYDESTNVWTISGCFNNVENFLLGPAVWANVTVNGQTGQGTADIWNGLADGCPGGKPATKEAFSGATVEIAEQDDGWDTDKDNCTNTQELRNPANAGGVRDPYNRWDWMDQWINGKTDGSIVVGDIGAVVARFGTVGTPGDPKVPPPSQFSYDTQADRGGALVGSAGPWNLKKPDGSIVVGDIGAVVAQFGHAGCAGKNPE